MRCAGGVQVSPLTSLSRRQAQPREASWLGFPGSPHSVTRAGEQLGGLGGVADGDVDAVVAVCAHGGVEDDRDFVVLEAEACGLPGRGHEVEHGDRFGEHAVTAVGQVERDERHPDRGVGGTRVDVVFADGREVDVRALRDRLRVPEQPGRQLEAQVPRQRGRRGLELGLRSSSSRARASRSDRASWSAGRDASPRLRSVRAVFVFGRQFVAFDPERRRFVLDGDRAAAAARSRHGRSFGFAAAQADGVLFPAGRVRGDFHRDRDSQLRDRAPSGCAALAVSQLTCSALGFC